MNMRYAIVGAICLAVAACGSEPADTDATELETPETDAQAEIVARSLETGDFLSLDLGAKIVGPQGPEVKGALSNAQGNFADIRSYVACPAGMDPCDPETAPDGTVYTYVHVVYPGEDDDPSTGSGTGNDSSDIERATQFRMTRPAHGFNGMAGYSQAEAVSAIGAKAEVSLTCEDGGLVWAVSAGGGGNQWEQGEPLTFYWQSTLPPAGPAEAYEIEVDGTRAAGSGPYPGAGNGAANACNADRVSGE